MKLLVDADELAACVACGLCLPHCPTYRLTGEESASPRGRIAAMRAVDAGAPADAAFLGFMDACVQCRGCEAACPSGVPFGHLMEGTRETLAASSGTQRWWRRAGYRLLGHHRVLVATSRLAALGQRVGLVPRRLGLPRMPLRQQPLAVLPEAPGTEAIWLFTGCVMDAWQRSTHQAVIRVLEAAGAAVALPGAQASCCGALHTHAGLANEARRLADGVLKAFPGEAPILVDSAGCGAQLKDYGHLLGTAEAQAFAARVQDVHEWLAPRVDRLSPPSDPANRGVVVVQDPCHLRHVQRAHLSVRTVLAPFVDIRELDDEGMCCGAGGAYAALHPETAGQLRDRKVAAIARASDGRPIDVVASANPGCAMHLHAAGLDVRHPLEIVDEALSRSKVKHGR